MSSKATRTNPCFPACVCTPPPHHPPPHLTGYVVVTDEATGHTIPNAFLDRIREEFHAKYAEKGRTVQELGLTNFG